MESSYKRKQYQSLILSILIHALLILLCIYLSLSLRKAPLFEEKVTPLKPATISMQTRGLPLPPMPVSQPPGSVSPPSRATAPQQRTVSQAPRIPKPVRSQAPRSEDSLPASIAESKEGVSVKSDVPEYVAQEKEQAKPSGGGITGEAFMGALRNSVRAEREQAYRGRSNGTGRDSSIPDHIQQRMDDWGIADYLEKIHRALNKAARLTRPVRVTMDYAINTVIDVHIIIDELGKIKSIPTKTSTGSEQIDRYIGEYINNFDLPPIPKRFNMKEFSFPMSIRVVLTRGSGYVQIYPARE